MGVHTSISRTIVMTYCDVTWIAQDNSKHTDTIKLYGNYTLTSAQGAVKKKLNAKGVLVDEVRHESFYGTMAMEKFAKYCEKANKKEW